MYNHMGPPNDPSIDCRGGIPHSNKTDALWRAVVGRRRSQPSRGRRPCVVLRWSRAVCWQLDSSAHMASPRLPQRCGGLGRFLGHENRRRDSATLAKRIGTASNSNNGLPAERELVARDIPSSATCFVDIRDYHTIASLQSDQRAVDELAERDRVA